MEALLREGAIAQIKTAAEYSSRSVPDVKRVYCFLAHEREKVVSSYNAFVNFIQTTLETDNSESKNDSESKNNMDASV